MCDKLKNSGIATRDRGRLLRRETRTHNQRSDVNRRCLNSGEAMTKRFALNALIVMLSVIALCLVLDPKDYLVQGTWAQNTKDAKAVAVVKPSTTAAAPSADENQLTPKSPAAYDPNWERADYPQDQRNKLLAFPSLRPGDITPVKLYLYGG